MAQLTIAHPKSLTSSNFYPDLLMLSTEVCFNPSVYFSITHTTLWSLPLMNSRSVFTPTRPTLALASNIYILPTSSPSLSPPPILLFSIKYLYHIRQNSPHTYAIFFSIYSTRMPSQHSKSTRIHSNTISKFIPFDFSSRKYGTPTNKAHRQTLLALIFIFTHINKFFLFIINPGILSFSQIVFSLHPIQDPKHLRLPEQLPTPPTNNTTILLPTLTDKDPASLIYIIFKTAFQQIYPAHYRPKNSESTVQPWIRA